MASAAEQLAANINFGGVREGDRASKAHLVHAHGALIVYRIGTFIPIPGIDPAALRWRFQHPSGRHPRHVQHVLRRRRRAYGHLRAERDAVHLGVDHRAADVDVYPSLSEAEEGRRSRPQADQPVHALSDASCWRLCSPTASPLACNERRGVVASRACSSLASTVITLTGGTMFLMWLGEQITARGVGNGISLIIFAGIVAELPRASSRRWDWRARRR
jgi:preprotein translocase subunit SecY